MSFEIFETKVLIAIGITFVNDCFKNENNVLFGVFLQRLK